MKTSSFKLLFLYTLVTLSVTLLCISICECALFKSVEIFDTRTTQYGYNQVDQETAVTEWKNRVTKHYSNKGYLEEYTAPRFWSIIHTINDSKTEATVLNEGNYGEEITRNADSNLIRHENKNIKKKNIFDESQIKSPCYLCKGANVLDSISAHNISHRYLGIRYYLNLLIFG